MITIIGLIMPPSNKRIKQPFFVREKKWKNEKSCLLSFSLHWNSSIVQADNRQKSSAIKIGSVHIRYAEKPREKDTILFPKGIMLMNSNRCFMFINKTFRGILFGVDCFGLWFYLRIVNNFWSFVLGVAFFSPAILVFPSFWTVIRC